MLRVVGGPWSPARPGSCASRDNTPDEVRDLAIEMLDRLDGRLSYDADDEARQARFRALFRPVHYSYGALSRVGGAFLRKHDHLL